MNSSSRFSSHHLFGIYEIDAAGTIFHHRTPMGARAEQSSLLGNNFFDAIACFSNAGEFQYHLQRFANDSHSTDEFRMNFCCSEQTLESRIKLAKLLEREGADSRSLIIIDIRKA